LAALAGVGTLALPPGGGVPTRVGAVCAGGAACEHAASSDAPAAESSRPSARRRVSESRTNDGIVSPEYCEIHSRRDSVPHNDTNPGDSMQGGISRRTFVLRGGAALASLGLLAACTPAAPSAPAGSTAAPGAGKPATSGK